MQYINHWPNMVEMALPEAVSQDLFLQLLQPFDSAGEAKEFWQETYCTLIILDHNDSFKDLQQNSDWNQIEFTLTYPEYTVQLAMDYRLLVAIVNDSGSGVYLVVPPELSHIISER